MACSSLSRHFITLTWYRAVRTALPSKTGGFRIALVLGGWSWVAVVVAFALHAVCCCSLALDFQMYRHLNLPRPNHGELCSTVSMDGCANRRRRRKRNARLQTSCQAVLELEQLFSHCTGKTIPLFSLFLGMKLVSPLDCLRRRCHYTFTTPMDGISNLSERCIRIVDAHFEGIRFSIKALHKPATTLFSSRRDCDPN